MTGGDKIWSFRTPLPFRHSRVQWHAETKFGHSAPFCHPEAAGPMTSRDKIWSFCTLVSSRGGGPDDARRYLTVIRTLLSSRGSGPDDMRRQIIVILHTFCHSDTVVSDGTQRQIMVILHPSSIAADKLVDTRRFTSSSALTRSVILTFESR